MSFVSPSGCAKSGEEVSPHRTCGPIILARPSGLSACFARSASCSFPPPPLLPLPSLSRFHRQPWEDHAASGVARRELEE
eukprot:768462-Hanusia_phi.AAC.3